MSMILIYLFQPKTNNININNLPSYNTPLIPKLDIYLNIRHLPPLSTFYYNLIHILFNKYLRICLCVIYNTNIRVRVLEFTSTPYY